VHSDQAVGLVVVVLSVATLARALSATVPEHGTMPFPSVLLAAFSVACYARRTVVAVAGGLLLFATMLIAVELDYYTGGGANASNLAILSLFFVVFLISVSPSFIALAHRARSGPAMKAAVGAAAGTLVLGLTGITSLINGQDLGIFNVIAALTNAAWLIGSIIIAVSLKRAGKVSTAVAVGLPIAWVATIPLSTVGGGVIAGACYLAIGYLLVNNMIERRRRCTTRKRLAQTANQPDGPRPRQRGPSDVLRPRTDRRASTPDRQRRPDRARAHVEAAHPAEEVRPHKCETPASFGRATTPHRSPTQ
jgi:hypothetical protein